MLKLKLVTCSGPNEHTDLDDLISLVEQYPLAEIAVQVSERKCRKGLPRYRWIHNLQRVLQCERLIINAALHVNLQWCNDFAQGHTDPDLLTLLNLKDFNGDYFFKRVQLNFTIGVTEKPDVEQLFEQIKAFPGRRFILPYNAQTADDVRELYRMGAKFDCLYDQSFGKGIVPATREPAVFPDIVQGYAGGLTADNVADELDKILEAYEQQPCPAGVFIDAHKGLEDAETHFDAFKCLRYLQNATAWYQQYCKYASFV